MSLASLLMLVSPLSWNFKQANAIILFISSIVHRITAFTPLFHRPMAVRIVTGMPAIASSRFRSAFGASQVYSVEQDVHRCACLFHFIFPIPFSTTIVLPDFNTCIMAFWYLVSVLLRLLACGFVVIFHGCLYAPVLSV